MDHQQKMKREVGSEIKSNSCHKYKHHINVETKRRKVGRPKNSKKQKLSRNDPSNLDGVDTNTLNDSHNKLPPQWSWVEKKVDEAKNEYTMASPNSRVFRLCKQLNQNYPEIIVSFNENVTSCTCEDFTRKQTMIKDPTKVMTYNVHITFPTMGSTILLR